MFSEDLTSPVGRNEQESFTVESQLINLICHISKFAALSNGRFRSESVEYLTIIIIYFMSCLVICLQCGKEIPFTEIISAGKAVEYVPKYHSKKKK